MSQLASMTMKMPKLPMMSQLISVNVPTHLKKDVPTRIKDDVPNTFNTGVYEAEYFPP